jgi:site-specific DNA-cytosine methylase
VKALANKKHRHVLDALVVKAQRMKYIVYHKILNTDANGIPQDRNRLYMVGIAKDSHPHRFVWPKDLKRGQRKTLRQLLDAKRSSDKAGRMPSNRLALANVVKAQAKAKVAGINTANTPVVVDVQCTPKWAVSMVLKSPTITSSRGSQHGYWVTTRGRELTISEMCRLSGISPRQMPWYAAGITASQAGHMLGNTMSVNVLERLLCKALWASGLVETKINDPWSSER